MKILFINGYSSQESKIISVLEDMNYEVNSALWDNNVRPDFNNFEFDLIFIPAEYLLNNDDASFTKDYIKSLNKPIIFYYDKKKFKDKSFFEGMHQDKIILDSFTKSNLIKTLRCALGEGKNKKISKIASGVSSSLLTEAVNSSLLPVFIHDLEGNIIFSNEVFCDLIKYKKNELIGKNISVCTDPQHSVLLKQINNSVIKKGYWQGEILNKTKDGEKRLFEVKSIPLYENSKKPKAIVTSVRDITLNRTIEEENKKFKLAIQHSHEVIFMTDTKGVINYINPQFEKFYQYKSDQIIGKTPKLLKSGQKSDEFYSEFWQNLMEGNNLNIEFENKTQNGDIVTVEESISSYFDDNNEIAGFISIQRDISEKKQNEELIRRALDKAEESDNLKAAFLNQMSHEIRTPLNSILGFMSLMEEELINRGVKDLAAYFDSVNRSALRLQRTIENILAMSNIQVGNYFTSFTKIDLESVLKLILEDFKSLAEEKNIEIIFENNTTEAAVFADSYTIIQSFQHLLDNAFKFTNSGKVEVKMFNVDDAVCVNIKDTGIGISKEYMEKLFKPFSQEEVGYGRSYDGNGLGLALAKEYLRLNYANISVKSEKGKGSVFTVTFYNVKEESES